MSNPNISSSAIQSSLEAAKYVSLLLNQLDTEEKEVFDLSEVVQSVSSLVMASYSDIVLYNNVPPALVTGNKAYFQEAIKCLLKNAAESQLNETETVNSYVMILGSIEDNAMNLDIIDNGKGIHPFKSFLIKNYRVTDKADGQGIGVGFAVSTITKLYNGTFNIYSRPKIGTRVRITIPL